MNRTDRLLAIVLELQGRGIPMTATLKDQKVITMPDARKQAILQEFQQIPGVGKSIANDLWNLGFRSVQDLKDQNPEEMYLQLCAQQRTHVDRCMLYVFRCAVYYASNDSYDGRTGTRPPPVYQAAPCPYKWWNWKDSARPTKPRR